MLDFFLLPWHLSVNSKAFAEASPNGLFGVLAITGIPLLYPWKSRQAKEFVVITVPVIAISFALWFIIGQFLRYILPVVPLMSLIAALNLEVVWNRIKGKEKYNVLVFLLLISVVMYFTATRLNNTVHNWYIPERYPFKVLFGLESRDNFLARNLPVYSAFKYIDEVGGTHKVLSIGNEFRLYTRARIYGMNGSYQTNRLVNKKYGEDELARLLLEQGYDFLLVNRNEINLSRESERLIVITKRFLENYAQLEYAGKNVYIYRITIDKKKEVLRNLLENGSFESLNGSGPPLGWSAYGNPFYDNSGAQAYSGNTAVLAGKDRGLFQRVGVTPGNLYSLGQWVRADKPSQYARLQINWLNEKLKIIDVSIEVVSVGPEWNWASFAGTAPPGSRYAQIYAGVHGDSEVWFDEMRFVHGEMDIQ